MADFALIAPAGTFHSSLGAFLDAFSLVRGQVERLFPAQDAVRMQTRLHLLTQDGQAVRLADDRRMPADGAVGGAPPLDLVHIAAFRVGGPAALDERLEAARPFFEWLRARHAGGSLLSASGSAVFLLAGAGLLDGLAVPLPRALMPLCRARFPRLAIDERRAVIEHDGIVLGSGLAADPALMVRLIERCLSPEMGRWLASVTGLDRMVEARLAPDPLVANAQLWLEARFAQDVRIADLATALSTSHQTLIRRFMRDLGMRPKDYVQHLRVLSAQRMLRQTSRSIEQIATLVGYRDARSFRIIFREHAGMSATAYRAASVLDLTGGVAGGEPGEDE